MQHHAPPAASPVPAAPASDSNGLAIAAFVISLVGLLATGGLLSPVGLILGLVALGRPAGRGFAIAAIVLGLLGSCGILIGIIAIIAIGIGLVVALIAVVAASGPSLELAMDMTTLAAEIAEHRERTGAFPDSLAQLGIADDRLQDPWGTPLQYETGGADLGFDLVSAGPDGTPGTADDVRLTELGRLFGLDDARITVDGGAGSGGVTRITAGDLEITVSPSDGGEGLVRIAKDGEVVLEKRGEAVSFGSSLPAEGPRAGEAPAAPPTPTDPPAPPAPPSDEQLPAGADVPIGGGTGGG